MRFEGFSFGSIQIDGSTYEHDVVIDHGGYASGRKNRQRNFEMTSDTRQISLEEKIPWQCRCLGPIGTGTGRGCQL